MRKPQVSSVSVSTVRKLRRVSNGAKDTGYFVMPPRNWLDILEKKEGRRVLAFKIKSEGEGIILNPTFENPSTESSQNTLPEQVLLMLRQGTLVSKLREIRKGAHVYRIINVPRSWVRTREQRRNRKIVALRLTTEPASIIVEPVFGDKPKPQSE